ncbi:hypothetical protein L6164_022487 [Bauhinia variegata]|uniref:Uncharacterized protein n=1 Tax=Bauhinia variegata TaxID=167791 RepID=A0ACB9MI86_BAUVA|nr:hypothetical protein L6164_022487 [Bauhinia variegata]
MKGKEQLKKSKVIKIDSQKSWDYFVAQANFKGCPVLVHFSASWCAPSVAMNPFFEELASGHQDFMFLLVDVDEVKEIASKFEIKAMPTFLLMSGGVAVEKIVGANPDELRKMVDGFICSTPSQSSI